MRDPYEVLALPHDADTETIRRRYLELVRQNPPERSPERFGAIREAYDQLRDPITSLENRLLSVTATVTFESLLSQIRPDVRKQRIATDVLLSMAES